MSHCERLAFAMFKSTYPPHIASEMKLDSLPVIQKPLGDGFVGETDLALDWELNKDSYMRLANVVIIEINEIIAERQGS